MRSHWTILILSKESSEIWRLRIIPLAFGIVLTLMFVLAAFSCYAGYRLFFIENLENGQKRVASDLLAEAGPMPGGRSDLSGRPAPGEGLSDMPGAIDGTGMAAGDGIARRLRYRLGTSGGDVSLEQEVARQLLAQMEHQRTIIAHTPSLCPSKGVLSSRYGWRDSPFSGERAFHKGVDIASRQAAPIYAAADGVVMSYTRYGTFGNVVEIHHGSGVVTRYGHLQGSAVRVGQKVKKGDKIGYQGDSGRSTGSHLHYEIMVKGANVNPQRYMLK